MMILLRQILRLLAFAERQNNEATDNIKRGIEYLSLADNTSI